MENKTETKKSKKLMFWMLAFILAALVLTAAALFMHGFNRQEQTTANKIPALLAPVRRFADNVLKNGVYVGGMTLDEARDAVAEVLPKLRDEIRYTLVYNGKTYQITADDFAVEFDVERALLDALDHKNTPVPTGESSADTQFAATEFFIPYAIDTSPVIDRLRTIAAELKTEPVDATFEPVPESVFVKSPDAEGSERFKFTEDVDGITVNVDKLYELIHAKASEHEFGTIEIPVITTPASVTVESLKANLVLRGRFSTSYAKSTYSKPNRVHNLVKATQMINGTVVPVDGIFSCNEILGYRSLKNGWKPAPAIIEGGASTEDQPGGGVCQVSTTIYNAVVLSDLKIVYRQAHSSRLSYVDGGRDATIDSGRIDFQWQNNTQHDIYVFTWVDSEAKTVNCEIYGEPFPDTFDSIEFTSVRVKTIAPPPDVYTQTNSLPSGTVEFISAAKSGSMWRSYVTYYKNGEPVGEKQLVATTTYRAHPNRYYIGTGSGGSLKPQPAPSDNMTGTFS